MVVPAVSFHSFIFGFVYNISEGTSFEASRLITKRKFHVISPRPYGVWNPIRLISRQNGLS